MEEKKIILETRKLTVRFGGLTAVNSVSMSVPEGSITGIIGPNGAGKTTLFNMITAAVEPSSGQVIYNGASILGLGPDEIARIGISRTFQNIRVCSRMTALENVIISIQRVPPYSVFAAMLGLPSVKRKDREAREQALGYLKMLGIGSYANSLASEMPYGQQRRLEIARAIATRPKLLLLDEPAAGMNNEECRELTGLIRELREKLDLTVVLIEHHMEVVMRLCDNIYVLNLGSLLREGKPSQIQSDAEVIKAYLGEKRRRN
ncbi:MAG TPA: ABC transporter ATP-binding protein [Clostridia bacterium]|nr:MAG: Lipopolysaccharide export system ATP-binding protein LptB [Firmicutes bacterium ADurb.Bin248]HOG00070.1 ABC transporter ATP-binding protein [Clostridia bacterium]HOS17971.1 ABC transporter ATP-binding protein [Clostridia bacterium]HPK15026.1 ABC transporter ATP-binding protein [Clostridia bacterium]